MSQLHAVCMLMSVLHIRMHTHDSPPSPHVSPPHTHTHMHSSVLPTSPSATRGMTAKRYHHLRRGQLHTLSPQHTLGCVSSLFPPLPLFPLLFPLLFSPSPPPPPPTVCLQSDGRVWPLSRGARCEVQPRDLCSGDGDGQSEAVRGPNRQGHTAEPSHPVLCGERPRLA